MSFFLLPRRIQDLETPKTSFENTELGDKMTEGLNLKNSMPSLLLIQQN